MTTYITLMFLTAFTFLCFLYLLNRASKARRLMHKQLVERYVKIEKDLQELELWSAHMRAKKTWEQTIPPPSELRRQAKEETKH